MAESKTSDKTTIRISRTLSSKINSIRKTKQEAFEKRANITNEMVIQQLIEIVEERGLLAELVKRAIGL